eukprot:COSAG06_NODE_65688_length_256_cov_0.821656_1_plen_54_part_01
MERRDLQPIDLKVAVSASGTGRVVEGNGGVVAAAAAMTITEATRSDGVAAAMAV